MNLLKIGTRLQDAMANAIDQLISIALGLVSIVLVVLLARVVIRLARKFFWLHLRSRQLEPDAITLIDNGISLLVYFAAVTLLLSLWGASWATLLTAISISTLAVVLGLQDLLKSMLGGVFVILDQPYTVGDHILLGDADGEVMMVHLRTTVIRSTDGHEISVPNTVVLTTALHNFDRLLDSDTVIRISGLRGDLNSTRDRLESLLAEEPAIAGTIIVAAATPPRVRTLSNKWRATSTPTAPIEQGTPVDLQITLILSGVSTSQTIEAEAVARVRSSFPSVNVSIRHGSTP